MDSLDPKLFQEYIHQAFETLERKEKAFLEASESESPKPVGEIKRLVFLLQKLARAVKHPGLYHYLGEVTSFLEYCESNWSYLGKSDKEGLLELYDNLATTFKALIKRPSLERFSSRPSELHVSVKAQVSFKKNSLNFNLGAQQKNKDLIEHEEIQKLAKDLQVFERGVSPLQMQEDSRRHLRSISGRLSALADKINLLQVSELFKGLERQFASKGFIFGFYGEGKSADRKVIGALQDSFSEVFEKAFFATDEENPEVYLKASEKEGCLKLEAQLNKMGLSPAALSHFEEKLEGMGFQTNCLIDERSGTCIEALAPKTLNCIEGQVLESWGSLFAVDMRYIKDCIKVRKEAIFRRRDGQLYLNSELGQLPVVDLGNYSEEFEEGPMDVVVMGLEDFQVAIPAQKIHQRQTLSLRGLLEEIPPHKYYKAVCFLENSMPGLLLSAKAILRDLQKAELKYSKYIEINYKEQRILVDTNEIVEITPFEKLNRLPNIHGPMSGLINYEGEPIIVHSLEEKIGFEQFGEFRHVLICKDSKGVFGLAVGADINIVRKLKDEAYSETAFSALAPKNLIKEVFFEEGSEQLVLRIEQLRMVQASQIKKVA